MSCKIRSEHNRWLGSSLVLLSIVILALWGGVSCSNTEPPSNNLAESVTEGGTSHESVASEHSVTETPQADATAQEPTPESAGQEGQNNLPEETSEPHDTPAFDAAQLDTSTTHDTTTTDHSTPTGQIQIYFKGDQTPETFQDGWVGQTPTEYKIALSRYWVLRSATDPSPQLCFDHGQKTVEADMSKDNLMGTCATATLKDGIYTHGKVKIDWVRYGVTGVLHYNGLPIQGKFTFFRAYSNVTYDGKSYKAQEGWLEFQGPTTVRVPYSYPPLPSPGVPGIQLSEVNGEFFMTFVYTKPLPIAQNNTDTHWARFHLKIYEAFRWADKNLPGYSHSVWDVTVDPSTSEEVKVGGVTGYYITASTP